MERPSRIFGEAEPIRRWRLIEGQGGFVGRLWKIDPLAVYVKRETGDYFTIPWDSLNGHDERYIDERLKVA